MEDFESKVRRILDTTLKFWRRGGRLTDLKVRFNVFLLKVKVAVFDIFQQTPGSPDASVEVVKAHRCDSDWFTLG